MQQSVASSSATMRERCVALRRPGLVGSVGLERCALPTVKWKLLLPPRSWRASIPTIDPASVHRSANVANRGDGAHEPTSVERPRAPAAAHLLSPGAGCGKSAGVWETRQMGAVRLVETALCRLSSAMLARSHPPPYAGFSGEVIFSHLAWHPSSRLPPQQRSGRAMTAYIVRWGRSEGCCWLAASIPPAHNRLRGFDNDVFNT